MKKSLWAIDLYEIPVIDGVSILPDGGNPNGNSILEAAAVNSSTQLPVRFISEDLSSGGNVVHIETVSQNVHFAAEKDEVICADHNSEQFTFVRFLIWCSPFLFRFCARRSDVIFVRWSSPASVVYIFTWNHIFATNLTNATVVNRHSIMRWDLL